MKKLMFIMMMLLGFVATSSSVYAQSVSVQSAEDIEGSYTGSLTKVYMNGDKSPVSPIETVVTSNGDGTYNFHIDAFKVGKMPGTITVDAKNIESDPQATIELPVHVPLGFHSNWVNQDEIF